jgi:hypothetical protein
MIDISSKEQIVYWVQGLAGLPDFVLLDWLPPVAGLPHGAQGLQAACATEIGDK